ncbi:unnamed protein product [Linum trigynum]|uniref:Uncharacterized protein n=1 Tax=Linum trigynum TaxID=586398 RepID=A0AAV2F5W9_9ROSI
MPRPTTNRQFGGGTRKHHTSDDTGVGDTMKSSGDLNPSAPSRNPTCKICRSLSPTIFRDLIGRHHDIQVHLYQMIYAETISDFKT